MGNTQPQRASRICLSQNDRVVLSVIKAASDRVMLASDWPDEEIAASVARLVAAGEIDRAPERVARDTN